MSLLGFPVLPERSAKVATLVSSIEKREKSQHEQREKKNDERGPIRKEGADRTDHMLERSGRDRRKHVLNCICKSSDWDQFMIKCHHCQQSSHGRCVGVTEQLASMITQYACPSCIEDNPGISTVYDVRKKREQQERHTRSSVGTPVAPTTNHQASQDLKEPVVLEINRKRQRKFCGKCIACTKKKDCGTCKWCKDMKKYGGKGIFKQKCVRRRCHKFMSLEKMQILAAQEERRQKKREKKDQKSKMQKRKMMERRKKFKNKKKLQQQKLEQKKLKEKKKKLLQKKILQNIFMGHSRKRKFCGACVACLRDSDCRKCHYCLDKEKYGGPGSLKQKCIQRKCIHAAPVHQSKAQQRARKTLRAGRKARSESGDSDSTSGSDESSSSSESESESSSSSSSSADTSETDEENNLDSQPGLGFLNHPDYSDLSQRLAILDQKEKMIEEYVRQATGTTTYTTSGTTTETTCTLEKTETTLERKTETALGTSSSIKGVQSSMNPIPARPLPQKSCGVCLGCTRQDNCGTCNFCKNMTRYGGPGTMKKKCLFRMCNVPRPRLPPKRRGRPPKSKQSKVLKENEPDAQKDQLEERLEKKMEEICGREDTEMYSQAPEISREDVEMDLAPTRICYNPGCTEYGKPDSKYCSQACQVNAGISQLMRLVGERIQGWEEWSVRAAENNQVLGLMRDELGKVERQIGNLNTKISKLQRVVAKAKSTTMNADSDSSDDDIEVVDPLVTCITCQMSLHPSRALQHMSRNFNEDGKELFRSVLEPKILDEKWLKEYINIRQKAFGVKQRIVCKTRDRLSTKVSGESGVCGCPLASASSYCPLPIDKCLRHFNWDRLKRTEMELERIKSWLRLEDLLEQERKVRKVMSRKATTKT